MIRLDKYIADAAGLTRSEAGKAIRSGAVAVDGTVLRKPERKIDEAAAAVSLNGMPCVWRRFRYYLLDKPAGLITASRDRTRETVLDLFPPEIRKTDIAPVGRLDKDTSGLLFLTNDGEFAHRVISPKYEVPKVYRAAVEHPLEPEDPERFRNGLVLADGTACLPAELEILDACECLVTVREGKYHQVRRMLASVGKPVLTLRRLSVGPLRVEPGPGAGRWRELTEEELCMMFKLLGMEK